MTEKAKIVTDFSKKNLFTRNRVLVGVALAVTAAASAYLARSELFASNEIVSVKSSKV